MSCRTARTETAGEMPWWGWALLVPSLLAVWAMAVIWLRRRLKERRQGPRTNRPESRDFPAASIKLQDECGALFGREPREQVKRDPDNLERIEGIGPKIAQALQRAGITTFAQLANRSAESLSEIVKEAGIRLAFPATWPEQAALAAADRWTELKELQGKLKGGRRV